ncbi:uncharacterized protein LOC110763456 [Prunus avium]|uniref:Uncharacterized protein LOC110763456 n=1 Tax=Prunus avium TaxID=42229 RepID=A0A6P5T3L8_PRUAV|nr:uncharacterized protein LOC110763456 [Prunus avium]
MATEDEIKRMDTETIREHLFHITMENKWKEVVITYKLNPEAHEARITSAGDTALHIAVSERQEDYVKELVKLMPNEKLKTENKRRNTPLHIAASMGNERMCECIATRDPLLVGAFNADKETPLFLAALHGKKAAFLCLHNICIASPDGKQKLNDYYRRKDGDTILHCAISGDYFDLAFQIIHLYEKLADTVNEKGVSPLHLLAAKPSAFRTGSHLSRTDSIIYHALHVDKLKVEPPDSSNQGGINKTNKQEKDINFIRLFRKLIGVVIFNRSSQRPDPETPFVPPTNEGNAETPVAPRTNEGNQETPVPPTNKENPLWKKIRKIREKKEKHKWSVQIMNELLERTTMYKYRNNSGMHPKSHIDDGETMPYQIFGDDDKVILKGDEASEDGHNKETNLDNQNIVQGSSKRKKKKKKQIRAILLPPWDKLLSKSTEQPRSKPDDVFVKHSVPRHVYAHTNLKGQTAKDIFTETHSGVIEAGAKWLTSTSESCSVVAALIATVAFATSTTVPGGVKDDSGKPTLENQPAFGIFAISSLVALCFSVTALVMFLSILTSRHQDKDFAKDLPRRLLVGLTSLFVSIASMLVSFCAGHFFVIRDKFKYAAFPVYAITCLPVTFFALVQFPLYVDLVRATFTKVPQRSYKVRLDLLYFRRG